MSKSKAWTEFIALSSLLLVSKGLDLFATWRYNPDLTNEFNPLVRYLGGGWGTMIASQFILLIATISIFAYHIFSSRNYPRDMDLTLHEFACECLLGRHKPIWLLPFASPKGVMPSISILGYILIRLGIIVSLFGACSWPLNHAFYGTYGRFYNLVFPRFGPVLCIVIIGCLFFRFYIREYRIYRDALKPAGGSRS